MFHYFTEKSREYDKEDFLSQFPIDSIMKLMYIRNDEKGLEEAVSKVLEGFDFDNFYKTFDEFKEIDMYKFVRELSEVFVNEVEKFPKNHMGLKGLYAYLQLKNSDKHTWWQNLKVTMRTNSSVGGYYKLLSHSKYDYELGAEAKEKGCLLYTSPSPRDRG